MSGAVLSKLEQTYQNTDWLILEAVMTFKNISLRDSSDSVMGRFFDEEREFQSCDRVESG